MVKKYYQILEISETATQEEIKKAYRKLVMKWHPDKNNNSEAAKKKFQEIGEAYGVLSNEELRKRYDSGETNFSENRGSEFHEREEEIKNYRERYEAEKEKIQILKDLIANEEERIKIMEEIWLLSSEFIDRDGTFSKISAAMVFNMPRVYAQDLAENGYSHLWEPYKDWLDKVWKMPITLKRKVKEESDELKQFKQEMFKAIKEVGVILENKEKAKQKARTDSKINEERNRAIEAIEGLLAETGLKPSDLEENYKEVINSLDKVWKIRSSRDRIKENISRLGGKTGERNNKFTPQERLDSKNRSFENPRQPRNKDKIQPTWNPSIRDENDNNDIKIVPKKDINTDDIKKYDNWTREELIREIEQGKLDSNHLQKLVASLKVKIKELEEEIRELKQGKEDTPEFNEYISKKENELRENKQKLEKLASYVYGKVDGKQKSKNPNSVNFLTSLVVGVIVVFGLLAMILIINKSKKNKY